MKLFSTVVLLGTIAASSAALAHDAYYTDANGHVVRVDRDGYYTDANGNMVRVDREYYHNHHIAGASESSMASGPSGSANGMALGHTGTQASWREHRDYTQANWSRDNSGYRDYDYNNARDTRYRDDHRSHLSRSASENDETNESY